MDKYCVQGENNKIILIEEGIERELGDCEVITGLNIEVKGNNNRIKLELPTVFLNNTFIQIGNDGVDVTIKKNCRLKALFIRCCFGANQKLEIGEGTTFNSGSIILDENAGCLIGNDCMFSSNIDLWATDGHVLFDRDTKEILNALKAPVTIGNHCWVGNSVKFTKNANLPDNTVVGVGSVVTKTFTEEYTVIAGSPAKVVKTNICWARKTALAMQKELELNNIGALKI